MSARTTHRTGARGPAATASVATIAARTPNSDAAPTPAAPTATAAGTALALLRARPDGRDAARIAVVKPSHGGLVTLRTPIGGVRVVDLLSGEQLPRIC